MAQSYQVLYHLFQNNYAKAELTAQTPQTLGIEMAFLASLCHRRSLQINSSDGCSPEESECTPNI
jgi:hypothetical protein